MRIQGDTNQKPLFQMASALENYSQLGGPSGLKFLASGMTKYDSDIQTHTIFGHTNSHIRTYKLTPL